MLLTTANKEQAHHHEKNHFRMSFLHWSEWRCKKRWPTGGVLENVFLFDTNIPHVRPSQYLRTQPIPPRLLKLAEVRW